GRVVTFHIIAPYGFATFQVSVNTAQFGVLVDIPGRGVSIWYQSHSAVRCECVDEDVGPLRGHEAFWELTGCLCKSNPRMGDPLGSSRVSSQKQKCEGVVGAQSGQYHTTAELSPGCGGGRDRDRDVTRWCLPAIWPSPRLETIFRLFSTLWTFRLEMA
ncbi:hypothetical protein DVH24_014179, partial [Malus domestica]